MNRFPQFLAALALVAAVFHAHAYPVKPVRVVLPYPPGGGGDVIIRTLQPGLEKRLGQTLVIDYKPGAAGNLGMMEVVKAAPDGYTLVVAPTNNFVINQYLFANMGFDPQTALAPATMLVDNPYLVAVSAAVPANTFAEFAGYAKANRGKLNFGSPGNATVPHLSGLMLSDWLAASMVHIPYRGSQPGLQALVANDVQLFLVSYGIVSGLVSSGKVRALAVASPERLKAVPTVPTTGEAGIPPGVISGNWWALAGPRGTDPENLGRIAREVRAVLADPDIQQKLVEQGAVAIGNTPAEARERMRSEAQAWKAIVEKTGAKVDN
jgi:tripartite-type tricarboxylate transporter receptor subunit TctC